MNHKMREKRIFLLIIVLLSLGLLVSIIGTIFVYVRDYEPLKAISPLLIGVFLTIIAQTTNIHYNEYIQKLKKSKELKNSAKKYLSLLIIDSEENKSDWYSLCLTDSFRYLLEFFTFNLHNFESQVITGYYQEFKEFFKELKKVERMKNNIEEGVFSSGNETRAEIEIRKLMEEIIEKSIRMLKMLDN